MTIDGKQNKSIYYLFIIIIYFLLFQNFIQNYIGIFRYFDEILAIFSIPIIVFYFLSKKEKTIKKYDLFITVFLMIIGIIGVYSSLKYKYQPIKIVLSDRLLFYKFFLIYYLFNIFNKNGFLDRRNDDIVKHIKFIIVFFFIFTILNYIFKLFPSNYRYGIMVNRLFFEQPTNLVATSVFLLTALIYFEKKIDLKYIIIIGIVIASTLRMKAFIFLLVFSIITIYVEKFNKKVNFSKILIIALICLCIAFEQIQYYFLGENDIARTVLLNTSIEIANDYFPLGTGFATFGSHFSATSYSPIYTIYGIQNVHGLTKENSFFISDSFWPMILGQFGFIGFALYFICIILILFKIQKSYSEQNKYAYISKLSVLAYLMISSTSESAFVNPMAILLAIMLAI